MENKQLLIDLFQAYFDCRKNKRNTTNAIAFELNYESNIIKLYDDIIFRSYKVGKSIAFIVKKPVKREIFACKEYLKYCKKEIELFLKNDLKIRTSSKKNLSTA